MWYFGHLISEQWQHVDPNRLCGILNFFKSKIQHQFKIFLNLNVGPEAIIRNLYGNTDWFRTEKEVRQSCLLSPCLFNLHTAWEIPGWINYKLESRQAGEIPTTSDMWMISLQWQKEELKSLLMRVKKDCERAGLKLDIKKKLRSWHLAPLLQGK